jgi:NAD(P)H dehydrogenase (quinone)
MRSGTAAPLRRGGAASSLVGVLAGDGSRMPTANELVGARYQGRKIAEIANKLHG